MHLVASHVWWELRCAKTSLIEPDFLIIWWGHITKYRTAYTQLVEQNAWSPVYERPGSDWWFCWHCSSAPTYARTQTHNRTHTTVKEAVRELTGRHLRRAIIKTGLNADSWAKLFNNLATIKMRKINRVKMHINLFLIWISSSVFMYMCVLAWSLLC